MIDFSKITRVTIPEGVATEIRDGNGNLIWDAFHMRYVSLGDSIAAGHSIDSDWSENYGVGSQYGENGNTSTEIVTNSYTDLIKNKLGESYGSLRVSTTSFAHSGDTVADLIAKLNHNRVKNAIKKADIVTISIGANDILGAVSEEVISDYINSGSLTDLENAIETNLNLLDADNNPNSYMSLFKKLAEEINSNAKYIFTTVYNPYKYLWIEEGKNGFFAPLLGTIPDMNIIGLDIDGLIKDGLLNTAIVQRLFERVNKLGAWVEKYITRLNNILKNKINSYRSINPNFTIVDTKSLFDVFPDRPENAQWHYNDLVNVEYTKGYNTATMDWGRLYEESGGASNFWWDLSYKYISAGFDINGFATDLVNQMVEKVIVPDLDPHPETHGQYVLSRSYLSSSMFGDNAVPLDKFTITYYKGENSTETLSSEEIWAVDGVAYVKIKDSSFTPSVTGYRFIGWKDQNGNIYSSGQVIKLTSNVTLTALWIEQVTLTYYKTYGIDSNLHSSHPASSSTGPVYKNGVPYYLNIMVNGESITQGINDTFTNNGNSPTYTMQVDKGSTIKISLVNEKSGDKCEIYRNGARIVGPLEYADYEFNIQNNTTLQCLWRAEGYSALGVAYLTQSYWIVGISE